MKRVLVVLGSTVGLLVVLWLAAGVLLARRREQVYEVFDGFDARQRALAKRLEQSPEAPFACIERPRSTNTGKQFYGVVDIAGSVRGAEGVELPFAARPFAARPEVVYFGGSGSEMRRENIDYLRASETNRWEAAKRLLRSPSLVSQLIGPWLNIYHLSLDVDVAASVVARAVEVRDGRLVMVADLGVAPFSGGALICGGRVELDLGEVDAEARMRIPHLAQEVDRIVTAAARGS